MLNLNPNPRSSFINDQWRVCFRGTDDGAEAVEIVDYHRGGRAMVTVGMRPIHPAEIMLEEFLEPLGMI